MEGCLRASRPCSYFCDILPLSLIQSFFPQLTGVNYRQEFPNMVQNNIKRGEVEMKVEEQEDS